MTYFTIDPSKGFRGEGKSNAGKYVTQRLAGGETLTREGYGELEDIKAKEAIMATIKNSFIAVSKGNRYGYSFGLSGMETALRAFRRWAFRKAKLEGISDEEIEEIRKETNSFQAGYDRGFFKITAPILLPQRGYSRKSWYMIEGIEDAIKDFDFTILRSKKRLACVFIHTYEEEKDLGIYVRDNDNIEAKRIVDLLKGKVFSSDKGTVLDITHCGRIGGEEKTEIYIIPDNQYVNFAATILYKDA